MPLGTYATRQRSQAPNHWKHLQNLWAPGLGATGDKVWDLGPSRNNGTTGAAGSWVAGGWQSGPESAGGDTFINVGKPAILSAATTSMTVLMWAKSLVAASEYFNEDSGWSDSGAVEHTTGRLDNANSGEWHVFLEVTEGFELATVSIGTDINDGKFRGFGMLWDGAEIFALYEQTIGTGTAATGPLSGTATNALLLGDNPDRPTDEFDGVIGLVGMWNYAMPRAMISEWMADPWRMLRPRRRVFAAPAAVVGGVTSDQGWGGGVTIPAWTGGFDG